MPYVLIGDIMKAVKTVINDAQYERLKARCEREGKSIYLFCKEAILTKLYMSIVDMELKKVK